MSLMWSQLRSLDGGRDSFEELCCQLARAEALQHNYQFVSNGRPDGGVECYATLPGGDEWAWQAKFFLTTPSAKQWQQVDESFRRAFGTHPRMIRFIVCLPQNLPDERDRKKKSARDKWNSLVKTWTAYSARAKRRIEFDLWDETEIFSRLSQPEHAGRHWFWFNRDKLDKRWFDSRLKQAIHNAGPRYTPELNVEVPVVRFLNALVRDDKFADKLMSCYADIRESLQRTHRAAKARFTEGEAKEIDELVTSLCRKVVEHSSDPTIGTPLDIIKATCHRAAEVADACARSIGEESERNKKDAGTAIAQDVRRSLSEQEHEFYGLRDSLHAFEEFCESKEATLANDNALVLLGNAGTGKTHLLCDFAERCVARGMPVILLLGEQFTSQSPPLAQIVQLLDIGSQNGEHFVQAMNAAGETAGRPALLIIDAMNEGEGCRLWPIHLPGLLSILSQYPYVRVVMSIRKPFERIVLPDGKPPRDTKTVTHDGFAGVEYNAVRSFFKYYKLKLPSAPVLHPEFLNPLFLKTLCAGLQRMQMREMPLGLHGITQVLSLSINSLHHKLWRALDYPEDTNLVEKAVRRLSNQMVKTSRKWIPFGQAERIVNVLLPNRTHRKSLFNALVSEGFLSRDLAADADGSESVIRFGYERFTDHMIVQELLRRHLDKDGTKKSSVRVKAALLEAIDRFDPPGTLIEALSVQLPEQVGKDLLQLKPRLPWQYLAEHAFLDSLLWRRPETISKASIKILNCLFCRNKMRRNEVQGILLLLATREQHPLNADRLHSHLLPMAVVDRDCDWGRYFNDDFDCEIGSHIRRIIDWAWNDDEKGHLSDEAVRLSAIVLSWFLISNDRRLRDQATKALACLVHGRPRVMASVLEAFAGVNDPYVSERLYAAAFGCAVLSGGCDGVGDLARTAYKLVFASGKPPADVLLRDWARNIIEYALHAGIIGADGIQLAKVRPPYSSQWPATIPSWTSLEERSKTSGKQPDWLYAVFSSVGENGDFARYIIGTNSWRSDWRYQRRSLAAIMSAKQCYSRFLAGLTKKRRDALDAYRKARKKPREFPWKKSEQEEATEAALRRRLTDEQWSFVEEFVKPFWGQARFDLHLVQRFVIDRVMQIGGCRDFPSNVMDSWSHDRSAAPIERLGKKYQWIAYHEALARLNDTFPFTSDDERDGKRQAYAGPWQQYARNIDPTFRFKEIPHDLRRDDHASPWFNIGNPELAARCSDKEWTLTESNVVTADKLADMVDPNGKHWLRLRGFCDITAPHDPAEFDQDAAGRRRITYSVGSCLVRGEDAAEAHAWLLKHCNDAPQVCDHNELHDVLFGEYPWAPSYAYLRRQWPEPDGWTRGNFDRCPVNMLPIANRYSAKPSEYDNSLADGFSCYLPSHVVVREMGLAHRHLDGRWCDKAGRVIFFDPGILHGATPSLLANPDSFRDYVCKTGYEVIWIVTCWKHVLGGIGAHEYEGQLRSIGVYRKLKDKWYGATSFESHEPGPVSKQWFRGSMATSARKAVAARKIEDMHRHRKGQKLIDELLGGQPDLLDGAS